MESSKIPRGLPWESGLVVVANPNSKFNSAFVIRQPFGVPSSRTAVGIHMETDAFGRKEGEK